MTGASECVDESEEELGDESLARFLPFIDLGRLTCNVILVFNIIGNASTLFSDVSEAEAGFGGMDCMQASWM